MASPAKRPKCRYDFVAFTWRFYISSDSCHKMIFLESLKFTLKLQQSRNSSIFLFVTWYNRDPKDIINFIKSIILYFWIIIINCYTEVWLFFRTNRHVARPLGAKRFSTRAVLTGVEWVYCLFLFQLVGKM